MKSIAEQVVDFAYSLSEDGTYRRPRDSELRDEFGGRMISSSNDGESIISFSPTDVWEFEDGSRVEIGYSDAEVIAGAAPQPETSKMSTRTITIEEISALSKEGRVALRHSAEFGQTEVGAHCAISAERRVVIEVSPTGVGYEEGSAITIYSAREAGEGRVFFDPATGRAWWGSMTTLRVLEGGDSPLEGGTVVKDAANAAYQRSLLSGAA